MKQRLVISMENALIAQEKFLEIVMNITTNIAVVVVKN